MMGAVLAGVAGALAVNDAAVAEDGGESGSMNKKCFGRETGGGIGSPKAGASDTGWRGKEVDVAEAGGVGRGVL